jgi:ORF6N domain
MDKFPDDFMFELTKEETETFSRSQNVTLKQGQNIKYMPFVFAEHGVLMISSVLRSKQANDVNISIMRVYTKMKEQIVFDKDILLKVEKLEKTSDKNNKDIELIFSYLKKLIEQPKKEKTTRIGFKKEW